MRLMQQEQYKFESLLSVVIQCSFVRVKNTSNYNDYSWCICKYSVPYLWMLVDATTVDLPFAVKFIT